MHGRIKTKKDSIHTHTHIIAFKSANSTDRVYSYFIFVLIVL